MLGSPKSSFISNNWQFLIPSVLLTGLFLYLLVPDSVLRQADTQQIANLASRKAMLETELTALLDLNENAVCIEDQLVIPMDNDNSLLPPTKINGLVDKLERSVVLVLADFGGEQGIGMGSGFFISPSQIVTNGHVVANNKLLPKTILVTNKFIGLHSVKVDSLRFDDDYSEDFAVISIAENIGYPLSLANTNEPGQAKLTEVFAAGFPSDVIESDENFLKLMNTEEFSVPDLVVTDGTISSQQKVFGAVSAFVHTAQMSPGNSGGPLVNSCGHVMGLNTFILSNEGNVRNFSLTSSEISKFLRENRLSPRLAAKECN